MAILVGYWVVEDLGMCVLCVGYIDLANMVVLVGDVMIDKTWVFLIYIVYLYNIFMYF